MNEALFRLVLVTICFFIEDSSEREIIGGLLRRRLLRLASKVGLVLISTLIYRFIRVLELLIWLLALLHLLVQMEQEVRFTTKRLRAVWLLFELLHNGAWLGGRIGQLDHRVRVLLQQLFSQVNQRLVCLGHSDLLGYLVVLLVLFDVLVAHFQVDHEVLEQLLIFDK